ncbi:Saccharopine dehydrogenase-domain-containing protein [Xylaria arbuscula]|nr:Saccharopine dehydrogenase-domain-containing protein [Xylaria arbuscula]
MGNLMIYGATGYTGRIACQHANTLGLRFILGGKSPDKLAALAAQLVVPYLAFSIDDSRAIASALDGVEVLLNCAGPFGETAEPLIEACIENGVHYLDVSAELSTYQLAERLEEKAAKSGVMLLPGCGGSVAMLGCLVHHVLQDLEHQIDSIDVALRIAGPMSRGSAITARDRLSPECLQRRGNTMTQLDINSTQQFDFDDGNGSVPCAPVTLPDLITIWKSTGVSNIRTFAFLSEGTTPATDIDALPDGPTVKQREANPYHAAVIATTREGNTKRAVLHTVNGYTFTGIASVEAAKRVLTGEGIRGFQTPVIVFGEDFIKSVAGSVIVDI